MSNDKNIFDSEYMYRIVRQSKETEEEFAYELISPFCERVVEKKLSKKELERILRKGMQHSVRLEKVKKAREEIENLEVQIQSYYNDDPMVSQSEVLEILDELIEGGDE